MGFSSITGKMYKSPVVQRGEGGYVLYRSLSDYTNTGNSVNNSPVGRAGPAFNIEVYKEGDKGENSLTTASELGRILKPYIKNWSIEEDEQMATILTLNLVNPEFVVSRNAWLNEGDEIVIPFGYGAATTDNYQRFILIRSHPEFPDDGVPSITFKGYDGRYYAINKDFLPHKKRYRISPFEKNKLYKRKKQAVAPSVFSNLTDDEIIDRVAEHYGFAVDLDATTGKKTRVKKKDTSDWEFIIDLCKANDFTAWVDWDDTFHSWVLHFRKKEEKFSAGYDFQYQAGGTGTLLSFSPTRDTTRQITDIEIIHFDKKLRKVDVQYLSQDDKALPPLPEDPDDFERYTDYGAALKFKFEGRTIDTFGDRPFKTKEDAMKFASYLLNKYQQDFMPARGTLIGVENIRPRQIHKISGVDIYSGDYYFTQVKQLFDDSNVFKTEFIAYRIMPQSRRDLIRRGQIVQTFRAESIYGELKPQ